MTSAERRDIVARLMTMQHSLRTVCDACETQADICDAAGAKRLSFAVLMVRESIAAYSKELNVFVTRLLAGHDTEAE